MLRDWCVIFDIVRGLARGVGYATTHVCVHVCMWQVDPAKDIEPGWANAEISEDVGPSDY